MSIHLPFTCANCGLKVEIVCASHADLPGGWRLVVDPSRRGYWHGPYHWCEPCFLRWGHLMRPYVHPTHRRDAP